MAPIYLFTDFGPSGPYVGQIRAVLAARAPGAVVIDLVCDAPRHSPRAAAYLLARLAACLERGGVFLCVVDPGVGSGRDALVLEADGRWFVGPDNGLLDVTALAAARCRGWRLRWRPARLSATFHGRDLFAPVAGAIAADGFEPGEWEGDGRLEPFRPEPDVAADLFEIVYLDHFGNAMTGIRAGTLAPETTLACRELVFRFARTFADVAPGAGLWFDNSNGLVELALNQASLAAAAGVAIGDRVGVEAPRGAGG